MKYRCFDCGLKLIKEGCNYRCVCQKCYFTIINGSITTFYFDIERLIIRRFSGAHNKIFIMSNGKPLQSLDWDYNLLFDQYNMPEVKKLFTRIKNLILFL